MNEDNTLNTRGENDWYNSYKAEIVLDLQGGHF